MDHNFDNHPYPCLTFRESCLDPRIVSPHEFYQAVGRVTQKKPATQISCGLAIPKTEVAAMAAEWPRFYAKQMDPVAFFSWLTPQGCFATVQSWCNLNSC